MTPKSVAEVTVIISAWLPEMTGLSISKCADGEIRATIYLPGLDVQGEEVAVVWNTKEPEIVYPIRDFLHPSDDAKWRKAWRDLYSGRPTRPTVVWAEQSHSLRSNQHVPEIKSPHRAPYGKH